jgi:hypothetical protein
MGHPDVFKGSRVLRKTYFFPENLEDEESICL